MEKKTTAKRQEQLKEDTEWNSAPSSPTLLLTSNHDGNNTSGQSSLSSSYYSSSSSSQPLTVSLAQRGLNTLRLTPRVNNHLHQSQEIHRKPNALKTSYSSTSPFPGPLNRISSDSEITRISNNNNNNNNSSESMEVCSSPFDKVRATYKVHTVYFAGADVDSQRHVEFCNLDTKTEIFGLNDCRRMLDTKIMRHPSQCHPGVYSHQYLRPKQFFYFCAPRGYGIRTLVANFCREERINLLYIGNPWMPQYQPGTYAEIVQQAVRMEPCIVFLDRIESHWFHGNEVINGNPTVGQYSETGSELFAYWGHKGYDTCNPPIRVWIVISGSFYQERYTTEFRQNISTANTSMANRITMEEYAAIMRRAFSDCLIVYGMHDDRPPKPGPYTREVDIQAALVATSNCQFVKTLDSYQPYFQHVASILYTKICDKSKTDLLPSSIHIWISQAFSLSSQRVYNQPQISPQSGYSTTPLVSWDSLIPSQADFEEVFKNIFTS